MHRIIARFINYAYPESDEDEEILPTVSTPLDAQAPAQASGLRAFPEALSIESLPIELISAILVFWAAVDHEGPWMATGVCKHWRRVVLASPKAWSHISLLLKAQRGTALYAEEEETPPRGKRRPLELWLERSGGANISLKIDADTGYPLLVPKLVGYCDVLSDYVHRIRDFTLQVELLPVAKAVISSLPPMTLDYCKVSIAQPRLPRQWRNENTALGPPEGDTLWSFATSGHTAQTLVFDGCRPYVTPASTQLANTTSLEISKVHLRGRELVDVLRSAGTLSLTVLKLGGIPARERLAPPRDATPNGYITLPYLRHLSLQNETMAFCEEIFAMLDTPNLDTLEVQNGGLAELRSLTPYDRDDVNFGELTAGFGTKFVHFTRRVPQLRLLCLEKSGLHDRHFIQALKYLDLLRELQMDCLLIGAPFMRALTPPSDGKNLNKPLLCPRLQRLEISRCDLLQGEYLVALVRSRNKNDSQTSPILDLVVKGCKGVGEEYAEEIRHIDPERLRLRLQLCTREEDD
ncbi:hypothetical protein PHLGIDRAFT_114818 [Phlebiopsis gigantea 11061_1 CR5-6]|uniref:F-box domain-containing protein n=1 Tax=Phlebiopsis gigantea (strain 11061_1 CR5-6) TaxID=745531 RepID=A0A0C3SCR6_PHLG1|nr:hypothetical protein PHLGIDRAFT_114818 [Phlebiopsis gigantea 11061_1 CR5-6]